MPPIFKSQIRFIHLLILVGVLVGLTGWVTNKVLAANSGPVMSLTAAKDFLASVTSGFPNVATFAAIQQPCTTPPPNMVAWYPGDGNANDIQGDKNGTP